MANERKNIPGINSINYEIIPGNKTTNITISES